MILSFIFLCSIVTCLYLSFGCFVLDELHYDSDRAMLVMLACSLTLGIVTTYVLMNICF